VKGKDNFLKTPDEVFDDIWKSPPPSLFEAVVVWPLLILAVVFIIVLIV
jgi:hypothetical protein